MTYLVFFFGGVYFFMGFPETKTSNKVIIKILFRILNDKKYSPVAWDYKIHQLHLCRRLRPPTPTNECPRYDIKRLMVRFQYCWSFGGLQSTLSLPNLLGPL